MHSVRKPWWQQATALVTVSTGGVITGFTFVPGATATMTSPTSMPLHLLALEKAAGPADASNSGDARLRSAIVNVANYYLRLAHTRTPAQMEALIWGKDSLDGADHGPSCAAFASLTLELAAQAVGQQSWVTGGTTYPWPLHEWADVRVDPNPASLGITSIVQDAQAHDRWHPLGDGYVPQPGDWVLFDGHVEVVTSYAGGVLDTIGAESLPNLSVNAHSFPDPLADQGVQGFVDNGHLDSGPATPGQPPQAAQGTQSARTQGTQSARGTQAANGTEPGQGTPSPQGTQGLHAGNGVRKSRGAHSSARQGLADIPGAAAPATGIGTAAGPATRSGTSARPAASPANGTAAGGTADIPGAAVPAGLVPTAPTAAAPRSGDRSAAPLARSADPRPSAASPTTATPTASPAAGQPTASPTAAAPQTPYRKYTAPNTAGVPETRAQQAFINQIAPGAIAAQQRFGVPAAVTIAQAIDESDWGRSGLAAQDHNLFGIKGPGPAGSVTLPTQEFVAGQWVTVNASFRVYHNIAESISDHAELLATSGYYQRAMADRAVPDAFANDLTGIYATDPEYGANLIAVMRLYNLYRFDVPAAQQPQTPTASQTPTVSHAPSVSQTPTVSHAPSVSHASAGEAPIPGTTPVATSAPVTTPAATGTPSATAAPEPAGTSARANAAVPGIASFRGNASGSTPTPGTAGSAHTPGSGAIPGSVAASGSGAVQGNGTIPGSGAISGSGAIQGNATIPGSTAVPGNTAVRGNTAVPGNTAVRGNTAVSGNTAVRGNALPPRRATASASMVARGGARIPGLVTPAAPRYQAQLPPTVATAFAATAKWPLARAEPLYRDVASRAGIRWELLAACDWMQCQADPRYSPVQGEKIGTVNSDGTVFLTKSEALARCANELTQLAADVYRIDLTAPGNLSVRALADAFAAFCWGGRLRWHGVSAMEFPYSVAGLTANHLKMHWPAINDPDAPDKPGARFRMTFGAVPVVLSLNYPATV